MSDTLELTPDQQKAVTAAYEGNVLIIGQLGSGKTVVAATAMTELLDDSHLTRILIITTPKIANTVWAQEYAKWSHTHHISIEAATGDPDQRLAVFKSNVQIVVATFNVLPWIKKEKLFALFDGLLIDETTKLKTVGGAQFKAIRNALKTFKWRCGLTGTPVSEDFMGLYGQIMVVDNGETFGTRRDNFLTTYFTPLDYKQYNWALRPGADAEIMEKVKSVVHVIPDYRHTLPKIEYKDWFVELPEDVRAYYDTMRKDMVTEHAESPTAAVLSQKLEQIACGFVYDSDGVAVRLGRFRLEGLQRLLNKLEDENVIICYWYKDDLKEIRGLLPEAEELDKKRLNEQVKRWNDGEIKHLLIHPRSAGHGLQLERGGHTVVWYCPQWSNDLEQQTNARVWRTGQTKPVTIYTITAKDTVDELKSIRVQSKTQYDEMFHQHLKGE